MSEVITYAKVGGPPDDWYGLQVIDLETGQEVTEVVECSADGGWLIRQKTDENGRIVLSPINTIEYERLDGRFEIRRP